MQKKLISSAIATLAASAALFAGAGTANAAGVTISKFDKSVPGSLFIGIHDTSGTDGWCTYSADWYVYPPVYVTAWGYADVVIIPAIKENRWWDVNVQCTNGNEYHGQRFF